MVRTTVKMMTKAIALKEDTALYASHSVPAKHDEVDLIPSGPSADHLVHRNQNPETIHRKEADMGKVVKLSSTDKTGRSPNSPSGVDSNDTSDANFSYRLFIIVNLETFTIIEWLKDCTEAHSYGDVVRQAVRSFAIHLVQDGLKDLSYCKIADDSLLVAAVFSAKRATEKSPVWH